MLVETKGNTTTIQAIKGDFVAFLMKITHEYKTFEKFNLIIDVTYIKNITVKEIDSFLPLSKIHRKAKKSFVIVTQDCDFNKCSDKLVVVPSLQEAYDIIEMEEIERDLGF